MGMADKGEINLIIQYLTSNLIIRGIITKFHKDKGGKVKIDLDGIGNKLTLLRTK